MIIRRKAKVFYLNIRKRLREFLVYTIRTIYNAIIFSIIFKIILDIVFKV